MAALTDPTRLRAYRDALSNWNVTGYVQFELTSAAGQYIERQLGAIPLSEIGRLMHEYVEGGGEIDEVKETRPEWMDHDFHHDLRISIGPRQVYIETRLHYQEPLQPDESWIEVVNIHDC